MGPLYQNVVRFSRPALTLLGPERVPYPPPTPQNSALVTSAT
jgi:hypothetical protein